ncbi:uncharacterized protein LOC131008889 [Salvia miltiorrhiza]|uniref:uncharacterized protein LOC131008889 n=1 Tax=Salvia miltiorrhiza TaxID=226208 RepID=UPI0025AC8BF9|nr:uncharacterized protein LOC131008889 [Salvia miltiorrhiza]
MATTERGMNKRESSLIFTEITPPHGWKQDPDFHYLRLTLPGFEANDITIHMDKYGHLVVRGTKQVTEHKYISFEETFDIPTDAKLDDALGMFQDNQIYCVAIPKVKGQQQHAITMPKVDHNVNNPKPPDYKRDGASIHRYDTENNNNNDNNNNNEKPEVSRSRDYLKHIRGDKTKMKIAICVVTLIALIVITAVIIVKLRRR